jgi:hypothetical protein
VLIVHAGNRIDAPGRATERFPASQVTVVAARVRQMLATLQPTRVVSNAAAGADLIMLRTAQAMGIPVHVLMPIERDRFLRESVLDNGADWVDEFDAVLTHAEQDPHSDVVSVDLDANSQWHTEANAQLLQLAVDLAAAADNIPVLAFTIRPIPNGEGTSVTDHFAELAEQAGILVLTLDPQRLRCSLD